MFVNIAITFATEPPKIKIGQNCKFYFKETVMFNSQKAKEIFEKTGLKL